jgi:hypothetical protein
MSFLSKAGLLSGTMFLAASAHAAVIFYDVSGSGFNGTNNFTLNQTSGAAATIVFNDSGNPFSASPPPTSVATYGEFDVTCSTCTTAAGGTGATFGAFVFDLVVDDTTDGGTQTFIGTSSGGTLFTDNSTVTITWTPATLVYGSTTFTPPAIAGINAPSGGFQITTLQGTISSNTVPEPATLGMLGAGLLGLGFIARKRKA